MNFDIEESDRQMILLALAILALQRPGWLYATGLVAEKFSGKEMFDQFREFNQGDDPKDEDHRSQTSH